MFFEGVVEGKETGEVFCVCYEGRPDCFVVSPALFNLYRNEIPFVDSVTLFFSAIFEVGM